MVRQYDDGDFLFGSDLEHSVTTPMAIALANHLNTRKVSVDSGFTFIQPNLIHSGVFGDMDINTTDSLTNNVDVTAYDGLSVPFAFGSTYDDFQDGTVDTTTRWDEDIQINGASASINESGGAVTLSCSHTTFGQSSHAKLTSQAGELDLDIGSVLYINVTATSTDTATANAQNYVYLYDGSDEITLFSVVNNAGTDTFSGAVKIESATNAKLYNFETNSVSNIDITLLSLPARIRYVTIAAIGNANGQSASASMSVQAQRTSNVDTTAAFISANQTAIADGKAAIGWSNIFTINDSNAVVKVDAPLYAIKNENTSYSENATGGLETAEVVGSPGNTITYKFDMSFSAGSPVWLDSWAAVPDPRNILL